MLSWEIYEFSKTPIEHTYVSSCFFINSLLSSDNLLTSYDLSANDWFMLD